MTHKAAVLLTVILCSLSGCGGVVVQAGLANAPAMPGANADDTPRDVIATSSDPTGTMPNARGTN